MADYFSKYYFEFQDEDVQNPALWRADIMDSQGVTPTEPLLLEMGPSPLVVERLDTSDEKGAKIIGRQLTFSYYYRARIGEPHPNEFFEADERRFRIEVKKNGVLDGVYYITPDNSGHEDLYQPFVVNLKALCGLSYTKGVLFNMAADDDSLFYDHVSLYDAVMTRGLLQILDADTKLNVLNSLYPTNIEPGVKLMFGAFIHTDICYDFVEGERTVYDVLLAIAKAFRFTIFIEQNEVWMVREQDLTGASFTIEQYVDAVTVNEVPMPDFVKIIGPDVPYDGIPLVPAAGINMIQAVKKADFEVTYKSINRISNFLWSEFDGSDFDDWVRALGTPVVGRVGLGTVADPYRAVLPYSGAPGAFGYYINQGFFVGTPAPTADIGDIVQLELDYTFNNTKSFAVLVVAQSERAGPEFNNYVLTSSGAWTQDIGVVNLDQKIMLSRSGKKRIGSYKLTSQPLPKSMIGTDEFDMPYKLAIFIFYPQELSDFVDGPFPQTVYLNPIKLGVVSMSSKGRHIRVTNNGNFRRVKETEEFTFIDTGEDGLSNTIFTGSPLVPVENWDSSKAGVEPTDIERHMAVGEIDQYQRSLKSWEGVVQSNNLSFYNPLDFQYHATIRFTQLKDIYDIRRCEHQILAAQVFEEATASVQYAEWDIDDEKD